MSKIKKENNKPSKYQELNDLELEVVCGGIERNLYDCNILCSTNSTSEIINIKSEAA
ncbi:hypothetical protein [Nodularia sp. UHCC 0506]|uniref:hypothetical protein n=1 Tax=Nodularia sp. UHCC 0506 TaxID=3110243 RepID=UPI002B1F3CCE|nr:hypothetical protein [Nodularia sp. UHCC 0506]MEA5514143.1 hypothetical protein [Nodularia sp. UHCC 0506]